MRGSTLSARTEPLIDCHAQMHLQVPLRLPRVETSQFLYSFHCVKQV